MISVRPIRETDAESFRAALDAVARERKYLARAEAPPMEKVRTFVAANVLAGHPQFVADEEGRIVGWCDALPDTVTFGKAHVAYLGIGVLREYHGRKLGLRLLEAVVGATRSLGLEKIELAVYASNVAALALYRKAGFEVEGVKRRSRLVDGEYDDIVLMGLHLKRPNKAQEPTPGAVTPRATE
jgi:RimJ/RimL family protein N-acetyltransferase